MTTFATVERMDAYAGDVRRELHVAGCAAVVAAATKGDVLGGSFEAEDLDAAVLVVAEGPDQSAFAVKIHGCATGGRAKTISADDAWDRLYGRRA